MGQIFAIQDEEDQSYILKYRRQGNSNGSDVDQVRFDPSETLSNLIRERDVLLKKVREDIDNVEHNNELVSNNIKLIEDNRKLDADNHLLRRKGLDALSNNEVLVTKITKLQQDNVEMGCVITSLQREKVTIREELKNVVDQNVNLDNALSKVKARNDRLVTRVKDLETPKI